MPKKHLNPASLFPSVEHGFSQVVVAVGTTTVSISGHTAWDANRQIVGRDCAEQARYALQNVRIAVEAAGGTLADIVALRIYVVDIAANRGEVGRVLTDVFTTNPPTARGSAFRRWHFPSF